MKLFAVFTALLLPFVAAFALTASAAQPKEDEVSLDKDGCSVDISWIDGMEVAQKVTISYDGIVSQTITLDDIVGDQSAKLVTVKAAEGVVIRVRLYVEGEIADEGETTITKCPTATPTSTATPTNTATPAPTSTPVPAATSTPVPPVPTPIVITNTVVQERVVTVEVPVTRTVIQPPSTGSAGLR